MLHFLSCSSWYQFKKELSVSSYYHKLCEKKYLSITYLNHILFTKYYYWYFVLINQYILFEYKIRARYVYYLVHQYHVIYFKTNMLIDASRSEVTGAGLQVRPRVRDFSRKFELQFKPSMNCFRMTDWFCYVFVSQVCVIITL